MRFIASNTLMNLKPLMVQKNRVLLFILYSDKKIKTQKWKKQYYYVSSFFS